MSSGQSLKMLVPGLQNNLGHRGMQLDDTEFWHQGQNFKAESKLFQVLSITG